jgi:hypothetical protein
MTAECTGTRERMKGRVSAISVTWLRDVNLSGVMGGGRHMEIAHGRSILALGVMMIAHPHQYIKRKIANKCTKPILKYTKLKASLI